MAMRCFCPAGEHMRRGFGKLAHANRLKRRVDARNHLFAGDAEGSPVKRNILPNDGRDKLIIEILENDSAF